MTFDFTPFFKRYETIAAVADQTFEKVKQSYPGCVACGVKCSDCCHALFDLTLIESVYMNHRFNHRFEGPERDRLLFKVNAYDRKVYKIKRQAHKAVESGKSESQVLKDMAAVHERCPLLDDEDLCVLYAYRPITCRLYGIPTSIAGEGHSCGKSRFEKGRSYPTVNLDKIQQMLYLLSEDLVKALGTPYVKMAEMIVPISMAILTEYDEVYLGLKEAPDQSPHRGHRGRKAGKNE